MILCPHPDCDGADPFVFKSRAIYKCRACLRQFSATSDGPWRYTKLPPETRAELDRLARSDATPVEIMRLTGVSYKTAWARKRQLADAKA